MLEEVRQCVMEAHRELVRRGLASFTFGNASAIDRGTGLVVIKPSGVPYEAMGIGDLVVTDLEGAVIEGALRPSSDLATHLELYRAFGAIGGIVHTHSHFATVWAQAGREIPCLGTTHADSFDGPVPVTPRLSREDIESDYEANTGRAIVRRVGDRDPMTLPAMLVANHASFCWGETVAAAVDTASMLEEVARLAYHTATLEPSVEPISWMLRQRHFTRKHGPNASYGQAPVGSEGSAS